MLRETRRGTPICIIIFTRYITPVIRLSACRCTCTVSPRNLFALARTYIGRTYAYLTRAKCSHAAKGRAARESRGPRVRCFTRHFRYRPRSPNAADLCSREALLSPRSRYATSFRREMTGGEAINEIRLWQSERSKPTEGNLLRYCNITVAVVWLITAQNFLPQRTDVVTTRCAREIVCK